MAKKVEAAPMSLEGLFKSRLIKGLRTMVIDPGAPVVVTAERDGLSYKVAPNEKTEREGDADVFSRVRYNPKTALVEDVSLRSGGKTVLFKPVGIREMLVNEGEGYFVPTVHFTRDWDYQGKLNRMEVLYELGVGQSRDMAGFEYHLSDGEEMGGQALVIAGESLFGSKGTRAGLINFDLKELPGRLDPGFRMRGDMDPDVLLIPFGTGRSLHRVEWRRDIAKALEELWSKGGFGKLAEYRHNLRGC